MCARADEEAFSDLVSTIPGVLDAYYRLFFYLFECELQRFTHTAAIKIKFTHCKCSTLKLPIVLQCVLCSYFLQYVMLQIIDDNNIY